ncbi:hypothetical protein CLOM_g13669 [Closterium sp. NIES-68]|nr:hypothetical protein CLOM_g13669 [Closterium sp. NIES-68]GJP59806.1 hypothetical protein CLOP_g15263 [Closterium sp. NIES-67]
MTARVSLALVATISVLVLLSTVEQVQAKKVYVGGYLRYSPWGPLTLKWKCPPIKTGDQLIFVWRQRSDIVQFIIDITATPLGAPAQNWAQCKTSKATRVLAKPSRSGVFVYTLTDKDRNNLMFASSVGNMCKRGQRFQSPVPTCSSNAGDPCVGSP